MLYNCKQFYLQHYDFYKHHQFTQGLPHLHGVFWLKEDAVKDYKKKDDNTQFDDSEIGKLIDNWIRCKNIHMTCAYCTPIIRMSSSASLYLVLLLYVVCSNSK